MTWRGGGVATPPETPPAGVRLRFRQLPHFLQRVIMHPTWVFDTVAGAWLRRRNDAPAFSVADQTDVLSDERAAVTAVIGCSGTEYARSSEELAGATRLAQIERGGIPLFGGHPQLVQVVYAAVRLTKPQVVLETGVAQGVTTSVILEALERNAKGRLYSIDLPVLFADETSFVGRLVPGTLEHRWHLLLGPSRRLLPRIARQIAPIDIFLHDAEHSYASQLREYRTVWPHLKAGGILISDDVVNPAFLHFARSVGADPHVVANDHGHTVGMLRKLA